MENRGFAALINSVERARESVERSTERIVAATREGIQDKTRIFNPPEDKKKALPTVEDKKQTGLLNDVRLSLKRIATNTYWTAKKTQWQIQKLTRARPTETQITEKRYQETIKRTSEESRVTAEAFKAASEVFLAKLDSKLAKAFPKSSLLGSAVKTVGLTAAFPFAATAFGGFAKVGEELAKDFSEQLAKSIQGTSKIDFGAMGGDVGQAVGAGLQKGILDFAQMVEQSIATEGKEIAPQLGDLVGKIFENIFLSIGKAGLALPRGYQRMQYQRLALPQIKQMAGQMMIDRQLSQEERGKIDESKSISIVVGGVNMDKTAGNTDYVARLMQPLLQGSHVVPIKNTWSNAPYDPKFKTQFLNLVKTALNTPVLGEMIIKNIKKTNQKMGKDSDFADLTEEDFADKSKLSEKILGSVAKKDMPIGKGLEAIFQGYNPDDVKVAAEALYYRQQFPDKPINIVGTSFGGFNAAGATQLLQMLGVEGVKGAGITTPFTGLMSPVNPENFLGSIGTKDYLYQAVQELLGANLPKDFQQVIEGAGIGHLLPLFLGNEEFRGRFQEQFAGRFQFKKGIDESSVNYFSKRYQNPEDENIVRTLQKLTGQDVEGYTYTADALKGYKREIVKKSNKITDEGLKKEVKDYLTFIDAVISDLEDIGAASEFGIKARPARSIEAGKKALGQDFPDFPEEGATTIPPEIKQQGEALKRLIAFRQKLRSEVKNFAATLATMQGQTPKEGWSFFGKGDDFEKKFQALEGFTNWLESDMLGEATDLEKGLAKPFLDFMKSLQEQSKTLEGGGEFDSNLLAEFEKLFAKNGEINKSLQLSGENLSQYYAAYLQKLVEEARREADQRIRAIAPNYSQMTIQGKKDFAASFNREIKDEVKAWRAALASGDKNLARTMGENLLKKVQAVKKVYAELQESAEDFTGKKSLQGQASYLTAVETEVIKGQPNRKGMANTGLTQLVEEAATVGDDTAQGFLQGVNQDVGRSIGQEFGQGVIEGATEAFDIQSPSKVFEWIGEQVSKGFQAGLNAIEPILKGLEETTIESVSATAQGLDTGLSDAIGNVRQSFTEFFDNLYKRFPVLEEITNLFLAFGAGLLVSEIIQNVTTYLIDLANGTFDAVTQLESLRIAFTAITGTAENSAKALKFASSEANRLGVDLKTLEDAYLGFLAVTKFTPLRGAQADSIFSTFAETASLRGLSAQEQDSFFRAINQALSKGKLSAEEVTGQLGEITSLNFKQTLARALGVDGGQLEALMKEGIATADILPKVAAQYAAENAAVASSSDTTAKAVARFNNSILELQRSFEGWIAPLKNFFNVGTEIVKFLTAFIPTFAKLLSNAGITVFLTQIAEAIGYLKDVKTFGAIASNAIKALGSALRYILPHVIAFVKNFLLVSLAVDAVSNAFSIYQGAFPELQKALEASTARAEALKLALEGVAETAGKINPKLPTNSRDISTNKTWNFLGIQTPFNLEPIRRGLGLITLGEFEANEFLSKARETAFSSGTIVNQKGAATNRLKEIQALDKELTTVRSRRFNIPAGDRQAYNESLKKEEALLAKREGLLKLTAQFQTSVEASINDTKNLLEALDELVARQGITQQGEASIRPILEGRLRKLESTRTEFEDLTSTLERSVNALELALRNLNEQAVAFNESLDRGTAQAKARVLRQGQGSQTQDATLQAIDQKTLDARLVFLNDQFEAVNQLLARPDFAAIANELKNQAEQLELNLENTATLDRLIGEGRSAQETQVLEAIKQQVNLRNQIATTEEQLAQQTVGLNNAFFELDKAVKDYFFNLTQQIKEAQNEVLKLLEKLRYDSFKSRLQRALVPGADSFVNGLIGQIQGIFDQAASLTEQIFGQKGARIGFAGEKYSLEGEITNFTRTLGGATEALEAFRKGLLGGGVSGTSSGSSSFSPSSARPGASSKQQALIRAANKIGLKPEELAAIISFETGGTFNPDKVGGAGNNYRGLIQFGPPERRAHGVYPGQSFEEQVEKSVVSYFKERGFKPGMGLLKAYTTVIAGNPNANIHARDKFGTSAFSAFQNQIAPGKPHYRRAQQFLAGAVAPQTTQVLGQATPPPKSPSPAQNAQAQKLTQQLIDLKGQNLNLGDAAVRQQIDDFILNLQQTQETIRRQISDNLRQISQSIRDLQNQALDLNEQFAPQTQSSQRAQELRNLETQYINFDTQLFEQQRNLEDNIKGIGNLITEFQPIITLLRQSGSEVDKTTADFLQSLVGGLASDKAAYEANLEQVKKLREGLAQGKLTAVQFVEAQARLRTLEADLERSTQELTVAQGQQNLEREKAIALLQAQQQLELDIQKIGQSFADNPEEAQKRIALAKEQFALKEKEIKLGFEQKKLEQDLNLLGRELNIAQSGSNLAKQQELELLQSQKQLELEILEIKAQGTDLAYQELQIELAKKKAQARDRQIRGDYQNREFDRRRTELDYQGQVSEGKARRFDRFGLNFFADQERRNSATQQENFRYERERSSIEQQFFDDAPTRDKLLEQAESINKLNIEDINAQYKDFGNTLIDLGANGLTTFFDDWISGSKSAGEAFKDFGKAVLLTIAKLIIQFIALAIAKAIAGAGGGGGAGATSTFSGFPSTPGVFAAASGGLVTGPGTATSDSIPALLSNGEYVIKASAVKNYGTHLLENLNNSRIPQVELGEVTSGSSRSQGNRSITQNITVVTPDAPSFNKSKFQIERDSAEQARKALLRL